MKITDIDDKIENFDTVFTITDFEHFFNVYQDKDNNYKYNLNSNLYLKISKDQCSKYRLTYDSHWPLISYNIYGTTRLAWLLMKLNDVKQDEVFELRMHGDIIYYLPMETVQQIINEIY